jgi:DNA ligase 1
MRFFSQLIRKIDETTSSNEKVAALVHYFSLPIDEKDKLWVVALFSHKRPPRSVSSSDLRSWVVESTALPEWLVEDTYHTVGDLAEALSLMWPASSESMAETSLTEIIEDIMSLKNEALDVKKEKVLWYWNRLDQEERFLFNKLMAGSFRIGVSKSLLTNALAASVGVSSKIIAHRLMGRWTPDTTSWHKLFIEYDSADEVSKPYPFLLANTYSQDIDIGSTSQWAIEYKWDGIRAQVIKRNEQTFVWSRGEELITDKFPEFEQIKSNGTHDFVIDGELLAYDDHPLNFQLLQTRIGRKNVTKKIQSTCPVAYFAYDILELNGEDVRHKSYHERRSLLKMIVDDLNVPELVKMPKAYMFQNWEEVAALRSEAMSQNAEGVMLKNIDSAYESGRKTGLWYKWKLDPYSIDAVMLYAQQGHGRRANLFTDFTFAVWHYDESGQRKLVPFAKAYSGLTDVEFEQITSFVRKNTVEKFGPVYSVKPQLVFEIAFEGIALSNRHKSGIALRFPRIKAWRTDKSIDEADELSTLVKMVK